MRRGQEESAGSDQRRGQPCRSELFGNFGSQQLEFGVRERRDFLQDSDGYLCETFLTRPPASISYAYDHCPIRLKSQSVKGQQWSPHRSICRIVNVHTCPMFLFGRWPMFPRIIWNSGSPTEPTTEESRRSRRSARHSVCSRTAETALVSNSAAEFTDDGAVSSLVLEAAHSHRPKIPPG